MPRMRLVLTIFMFVCQFMALFGKMTDKAMVPAPINPEVPFKDDNERRQYLNERRRMMLRRQGDGGGQAGAFSEAFDWANLKFGDIFKLREDSCAGTHLKDFFATVGTFASALFGSGFFRAVLDFFIRTIIKIASGETPTAAAPGMQAGEHELHIIKTSYLGLCQAMGALICTARYTACPCGWLGRALWALIFMWMFCVPVGFIVLFGWKMHAVLKRGDAQFERNPGSSWFAFFKKIHAVQALSKYLWAYDRLEM